MPTALITGISGQDGSYLSEILLAEGYDVHGVVRTDSASDRGSLAEGIITHVADFEDGSTLRHVVDEVAPDEIYNLAAVSSVFRSWQDPIQTANINGLAVAHLLDAALQSQEASGKPVRFVQASSAELFGVATESPQTEQTPINPSSPYGAAKAYAHHLVGVYRQRGLFASSCILYNHESPRRPESFVTRKITAGVARISLGLQDGIELGTLDSRRDWGWAPDYANALHLAARAESADNFIVATGETHSIRDFLDAAFERAGIADWSTLVTVNEAFARPVDPAEQVGDASHARETLGWTPTIGFAELVNTMVDNDLTMLRD